MRVAIITKEQGIDIFGKEYGDGMLFNPVLTKNMDIIISEEEISQLTNQKFEFVKDLELKEKGELEQEIDKKAYYEKEKQETEARLLKLTTELEKLPIKG